MIILLFGGTGMLGTYLHRYLNEHYEVILINKTTFDIENDSLQNLDNIINKFYHKYENLTVINCSGIIPQKYSSNLLRKYIKVNSVFPHILSSICDNYKCNFIHISTDCVYNGINGNYSIQDSHSAETIYGISKSLGEPENATIIRTSIIGEENKYKKSLLEWIISNKNKSINGFNNHLWNGVTCLSLAKYIYYIIKDNLFWKGVKHITSNEIISKYQLCNIINEIYELNINILLYESDIPKNMTLSGEVISDESIYEQIKNQKNYI